MGSFFIEYRDPMFGLIILFATIFVISFVNYWWGAYKSKEEKDGIEDFIKRFEIVSDEGEFKSLLKDKTIPLESLALLAHGYSKSGDFEKAIGLYLLALERTKHREQKKYILTELGRTYFSAGFLRRSCEVFLDSLKLHPRNEESLKYLSVSYEKLKEYNRAIEVLDSLEELGAQVTKQRDYLKSLSIIYDYKLSNSEKIKKLTSMLETAPFLQRKIFEFWQVTQTEVDLKLFETFDHKKLLDLLWLADQKWFDISTCKAPLLQEISSARGLIEPIKEDNQYFELEVLSNLNSVGYSKASLNFEYICEECKNSFPVHFNRCPSCQAIESANIEPIITKEIYEENISFQ
ncbi:tetratricopeptide repeat protein [Sulfurospirillum arcachonense]|uniref:tetratricopeptide repeat protein n=1 Tax=Sulfurospirillum arcachonense TaxID=57666 RepID=UPI0004692FCF|nr:tetratricopeptide repeat protein [Sulfurospirillum arcachonense]